MATPGTEGCPARVTVIGIGSRCRCDDGVGLVLVAGLAERTPAGVATALWADCDVMDIAHQLAALRGPVLFVDCAAMGLCPGDWRLFRDGEARLGTHAPSVSTHGLSLADGVALARGLGFAWPVWFFGVEPATVALGEGLSAALRARLPQLAVELADAARRVAGAGKRSDGR